MSHDHDPHVPHNDRKRIAGQLYALVTKGGPSGTQTPNPRIKSGVPNSDVGEVGFETAMIDARRHLLGNG